MPTVFTHAVVGVAISTLDRKSNARLGLAAAACAVVPDLDMIPVWLGVPWYHLFGHRGITHSLAFAVALGGMLTATIFRRHGSGRLAVWLVLSAATASHGVLDSITNGGPGVALFAPFDTGRYLLPWRPVPVSPISVRGLLTARGAAVLRAEVLMLWLPALLLMLVATRRRWR